MQREICSDKRRNMIHSEPGRKILASIRGQIHNKLSSMSFTKIPIEDTSVSCFI